MIKLKFTFCELSRFSLMFLIKLYAYCNRNKFAYERTITKSKNIDSYQHKGK